MLKWIPVRVCSIGLAGLLAACGATESPTSAVNEEPAASLTAQALVYDSAYDVSGYGNQGHAYGISDKGLIVGDVGGLPFAWQKPSGPLQTLSLPAGIDILGGATSIAPRGKWIAGYGGQFGFSHAVVWDANRNPTDLGTLGGTSSWANAVGDNGVVVGWSEDATGNTHAFRYTPATGMVDMGLLPGTYPTAEMLAYDVSGNQVVGCGNGPTGSFDMWSWTPSGGFVTLASGGFTCAYAVNSKGLIAGTTDVFVPSSGFTWSRKGGFVQHVGGEFARDINGNGIAVGDGNGFQDGYVADLKGTVVYLPHLLPFNASSHASAWGINGCGDVVGSSNDPFAGEIHAVWWPGHQCP
jgi:probable HAF family extracellular repeat protein